MRTEDLRVFFEIANTGSLTAAATALGVPKSTVSRRLARLELELEAELVHRSSRAIQLTEVGSVLHQQGTPALAYLDDLSRALRERSGEVAGPLRIAAAQDLAMAHLGVLMGRFVREHPRVRLSLVTSNRFVDLIADGVDIALRIHSQALPSSSALRTRTLATLSRGLYASAAYLEKRGKPRRPADLEGHAALAMSVHRRRWTMTRARTAQTLSIELRPQFESDDHHTLARAAEQDAGIAELPVYLGDPRVQAGTLVRVMSGWSLDTSTLSAVWLASHHTSARIRAFVDACAEFFRPPPWVSRRR